MTARAFYSMLASQSSCVNARQPEVPEALLNKTTSTNVWLDVLWIRTGAIVHGCQFLWVLDSDYL